MPISGPKSGFIWVYVPCSTSPKFRPKVRPNCRKKCTNVTSISYQHYMKSLPFGAPHTYIVVDACKGSAPSAVYIPTHNMGLINKVDMVCLSPVGYGV